MSKPIKMSLMLCAFIVAVLSLNGLGVAQIEPPGGIGQTHLPSSPDCGETEKLAQNFQAQPKTVYVEISDCCDGVDSILYINNIQNVVYYVPDGGSICAPVTLQQGERLYLDCNGSGNGNCPVEIRNSCENCP